MEKSNYIKKFIATFLAVTLVVGLLVAPNQRVLAANNPPTDSVTLGNVMEYEEMEITYNALLNAAIELGYTDNNMLSFEIQSIDSGYLRHPIIGSMSAGGVITKGERVYWQVANGLRGLVGAFTVRVVDGEIVSNSAIHVKINVQYTNHEASGNLLLSGTIAVGETLTGFTDYITDADGLGTFQYQWMISNNGVDWANIPLATSSTYTLTQADEAKHIKLQVKYIDGGGTEETLETVSARIAPGSTQNNDTDDLMKLKETIETFGLPYGYCRADVDVDNRTVTVYGNMHGINDRLILNIPEYTTVVWNAGIYAKEGYNGVMFHLEGEGGFEVKEGMITAKNGIAAIYAEPELGFITIDGGHITSEGNTIYASGSTPIYMRSGAVHSGTVAITSEGIDGYISVTGGLITSKSGTAISLLGDNSSMEMDNGTILTRSNDLPGAISSLNGHLSIDGDSIIIAWDQKIDKTEYTYGSDEDLIYTPDNAKVNWTSIEGMGIIEYELYENEGYIPIYEVNVIEGSATVTSVSVKTPPSKTTYVKGEALDLSGLVVTLLKSDGSSEDVSFENFASKNITTNPASGTILTTESSVVINTPNNQSVNQDLTINPANHSISVTSGGYGTVMASAHSAPAGTEITLIVFPYAGYRLKNWLISGGNITITNNKFIMPSEPVTITAVFEAIDFLSRTVTFVNGVSENTTRSISAGTSIGTINWPANPVKSGYTFDGWYTGENGIGNMFTSETIVTGNLTVYAKWTPNNNDNGSGGNNGGSGGNNGGSGGNNGGSGGNNGSSGGNNSGSGNTSQPSNPAGTEKITVDVKQGNTDSTASQITIERTTKSDGQKIDTVTYEKDKAVETVKKLKEEGKDAARIVIPNDKNQVSETFVKIPLESVGILSAGKIDLQIDTEEAKIGLSKDTLKNLSQTLKKELYFHLVPVKDEKQKETALNQAILEASLINKKSNVSVIGNPVTIETNMSSTEADITLPLTGIKIPTNTKDKEALLKQLAVYIEHSDGDKELVQGKLIEYKEGVYGIRFHIKKFSTFTVVKTDAFVNVKSAACEITKVTSPTKAVIQGNKITASVSNGVSSITVKAAVSSKATWKLYSDKACKKVISKSKLKLKVGANTVYLKVTAENGKTKVYTLKITRKAAEYETHIKLGVIGKKSYAETVAKIFKQEYDSANVKVQKKGKYYLVTMDFNNKTAAKIACDDMIRRKYIVNYYFE